MKIGDIRRAYGVPATAGGQVRPKTGRHEGRLGTIMRSQNGLLRVRGEDARGRRWAGVYHPQDLDYLPLPPRTLKPGTDQEQLVRALEEGPGTPRELADETGIPVRACSAHLSNLYRMGLVDRRPWELRGFLYEAKAG